MPNVETTSVRPYAYPFLTKLVSNFHEIRNWGAFEIEISRSNMSFVKISS